jgi:hypothetical protein
MMQFWLEHPAVQAGVLPFFVALALVLALRRTALAWLAPTAAYATTIAVTTGFAFTPLTASRKVLLLALIAPLAGWILERGVGRGRRTEVLLALGAGLLSVWAFYSVLAQRELPVAVLRGAGVALFVAANCWLVARLREDAPAASAAGLGLGLAAGISALLSASIGYFGAGIALAAGSGALLAVQFTIGGLRRPGMLAASGIGLSSALFGAGTLMLAQLPWYALAAMLVVPAAASVPLPARLGERARIAVRTLVAVLAASLSVFAAWVAARAASG